MPANSSLTACLTTELEDQRYQPEGTSPRSDLNFLEGGEMGALMRAHDWASTSLGPISGWPQSLKTTVGILLRSPVPIVLLWGPDGIMIYNDAYSDIAGGRHPRLFGSKVREGWPEVADFNDNVMKVGLSGGTLSYRDKELTLYRKGVPEQVWMNLDYSPVLDESGLPAGVLAVVVETTDRVLAERALAKTQERLSYALNASGMVGTFDLHISSNTFYSDARFAAMFSVDPGKGETGTPLSEYLAGIHPEDVGRVFEAINHTIATGERYSQEYRLLQKGGAIRWIEARGECLYDDHGKPLRFPGAVVDITERKQAEVALRESEARFRNLADNAPVMVWVTEPDGTCTFLSRSWCEFTGQTQGMGLGFGWISAIHPEDRDEASRAFLAANDRREAFRIEYRLRRADGEYRWAIDAAVPRFGEDGEFLGYVGSLIDLTERKRVEEALRESEKRFRTALEIETVGVVFFNADGEVTDANDAFLRMTGYSREDLAAGLLRRDWMMLPKSIPPSLRSIEDLESTGQLAPYEREYIRKDGSRVWFLFAARMLSSKDGVEFAVDISESKRAEEQQRLLMRELNHRVKNLFAITSGMVALSARSARTPQEMGQTLRGRLDALVRANDLIRPGMIGPGEESRAEGTTMEILLRTVLLPYVDEARAQNRECIILNGPPLPIGKNAVTSLALILHEIATNAAKYGALSAPDGRIRVDWTIREQHDLYLRWEESDGPVIVEPPRDQGFGSNLVKRSVTGQLQGNIEYDWRPEGLTVHVTVPLECLDP
jgi:PAS domain S-box-containing protein